LRWGKSGLLLRWGLILAQRCTEKHFPFNTSEGDLPTSIPWRWGEGQASICLGLGVWVGRRDLPIPPALRPVLMAKQCLGTALAWLSVAGGVSMFSC